ncbi:hypothetical protein [Streptosporangium carneum]|uniref:Uncharacterized protein n=2 Tax=Streptosporangium carneum TaxID=47481 RepID=A0A9W6MGX4_9ACTN|nr:hypothetical protein GCM10017600_76560 [Streptosporangium carneum]
MVSVNQGVWVPGSDVYRYGYGCIPNIPIVGAPSDTNFRRWSMLHDGAGYRLYAFKGSTRDTLYQFAWDGTSYAYDHESIPVLTLTNAPADADSGSFSVLHSGDAYHLYLRRIGDPTVLYQFVHVPGTSTYQWAYGDHIPVLRVTGFPEDTDWSRWTMLHDGSAYRIYAFHHGSNDALSQGTWNPATHEYQYAYDSIPQLRLEGYPSGSDAGRVAALHDGAAYRFYFQAR